MKKLMSGFLMAHSAPEWSGRDYHANGTPPATQESLGPGHGFGTRTPFHPGGNAPTVVNAHIDDWEPGPMGRDTQLPLSLGNRFSGGIPASCQSLSTRTLTRTRTHRHIYNQAREESLQVGLT